MNNQFAVIGLGLFGTALCEELERQDAEVLAIDIDELRTRQVATFCSHVIVADATDENTVAELGLADFDIVFVAIGDSLETSILTTLVLKEAGVKKVWVKARDKFHAKILKKVGADKVINPEWDMGRRVAQSMFDTRLVDYLELGHDMVLTEFVIGLQLNSRTLADLNLLQQTEFQLLAIKRGQVLHNVLTGTMDLALGDILILAGNKHAIDRWLDKQ
ncbi:potassium channel family protein [Aeromonas molluscorum]|jgi:trk system potassium uptake protein|uniref:Potassium uptake protein KtrA n=1 Tax=Aeromonas molluscorum 848 TaxID=1268236 RepID=R1F7E6_9GAMM|nr:TrkA family potassium uptake protein [Aeromonas molluscorum]EOD55713.1 potassium uptake protein KtrA [Aeromonas molluscorum 848]